MYFLQNVTGNTTVLSKYLKILDERIGNLTRENALLKILVDNATKHANNLKELAEYINSLLSDPNKYADKAVKAVKNFENIVKNIEEVLKLAKEANRTSYVALDLVSVLSRDV